MTTYVDSSVVLRMLFGESGALTEWAKDGPISSELLRVECLRVVDRARLSQRLDDAGVARLRANALEAVEAIDLVAVNSDLLQRAAEPFPTTIRTLDAIHLATALAVRAEVPDVRLATHDRELAAAATAVGFEVVGASSSGASAGNGGQDQPDDST